MRGRPLHPKSQHSGQYSLSSWLENLLLKADLPLSWAVRARWGEQAAGVPEKGREGRGRAKKLEEGFRMTLFTQATRGDPLCP